MNYLTDQLLELCKSETVALSAGFSETAWADHVFVSWGDDDFSGGINIGRLPVVVIREITPEYFNEAENGGTREGDFIVRIYGNAIKPRLNTNVVLMNKIKQAILSQLKNYGLEETDIRSITPQITPYSVYIDITITSETSYDLDYEEN